MWCSSFIQVDLDTPGAYRVISVLVAISACLDSLLVLVTLFIGSKLVCEPPQLLIGVARRCRFKRVMVTTSTAQGSLRAG